MSDLPTIPEHTPSAAAAATPAEVMPPPSEPGKADPLPEIVQRAMPVAVVVLFLLLAASWFQNYKRVEGLREELAKALKKSETTTNETSSLAKTVQEQSRELAVKVGVLENRQTEAQSQQLALEQLYQDLSKNRDEWALAETEQVLSTASQQLQLSGNVSGALIALQNADRSLSRSDKPQFISIRRAIAKDIDRLKALPSLDMIGVAVRIDEAINQVDSLPMLAGEAPAPVESAARPVAKPAKAGAKPVIQDMSLTTRFKETWSLWSNEMWNDMRSLIRVRKVDTPDALMLAPGESYFVRESVKLRLLNARVALLSRNESVFRSDLVAAQETLARYFDTRARSTQTTQALLRQVQANNLAIEMPSLAESLNAVRNYKAK
jgi:uroporphyrin-3 C-methyltransferase/uroporphyrinogen III methyltransferase/synthase